MPASRHLRRVLQDLRDAGFSGKLGLSVDKFHGIQTDRLVEFCRMARRIFDRDNILSLSYASRAPDQGLEPVHKLAAALDGVVEWSEVLHRYLLVAPDLTMTLNWNHLAPVERAERLAGGWDGDWFVEDYCEGPGQALIVNPRGEVKPCCGFASDLDQLTIGNIHTDTVAQIVRRARRHPYVGKVFREGLTAIRDEILARDPDRPSRRDVQSMLSVLVRPHPRPRGRNARRRRPGRRLDRPSPQPHRRTDPARPPLRSLLSFDWVPERRCCPSGAYLRRETEQPRSPSEPSLCGREPWRRESNPGQRKAPPAPTRPRRD